MDVSLSRFKWWFLFLRNMGQEFLDGETVLAFDLETTGVSTANDRIVQIALIGSDKEGQTISYESLVNPRRPIPLGASEVHGIYDDEVKHLGDFSSIAQQVHSLVEGAVIVGHNVRNFDMQMLDNEFRRLGKLPPKPKAIMDTLEIVRRVKLSRPHNLGSLCARHGISLENAHTATADAAASMLLFWRLTLDHSPMFRKTLEEVERWLIHGKHTTDDSDLGRGLNDLDMLDSLGKIRVDGEHYILAFGRHRGRSVSEVKKLDPGYLNWLLSPSGIEDEEARGALKKKFT